MKGEIKAVEYGIPAKKMIEHDEAQNLLLNGHNNFNGIDAVFKQNENFTVRINHNPYLSNS